MTDLKEVDEPIEGTGRVEPLRDRTPPPRAVVVAFFSTPAGGGATAGTALATRVDNAVVNLLLLLARVPWLLSPELTLEASDGLGACDSKRRVRSGAVPVCVEDTLMEDDDRLDESSGGVASSSMGSGQGGGGASASGSGAAAVAGTTTMGASDGASTTTATASTARFTTGSTTCATASAGKTASCAMLAKTERVKDGDSKLALCVPTAC